MYKIISFFTYATKKGKYENQIYFLASHFAFYVFYSVVVFRKANKIGFFIKVTPDVKEGDVKVGTLTTTNCNLGGGGPIFRRNQTVIRFSLTHQSMPKSEHSWQKIVHFLTLIHRFIYFEDLFYTANISFQVEKDKKNLNKKKTKTKKLICGFKLYKWKWYFWGVPNFACLEIERCEVRYCWLCHAGKQLINIC